ncbi:methyltransferase family protein [Phaeodactylibacter luteus]|uniref:DUF1295 domain-containing protein n=1 Tax=Phaeodactylibacter luteus TaxID=1564516 RepID=A0A5C6RSM0_9BACT|nr:isoprenylcysteine carboxylmethyltransferase family protein [Phaeodactylibacter luteus]TXB64944.1 DUF1295 domain-containing protein [Phaeodactylibacter luteus]
MMGQHLLVFFQLGLISLSGLLISLSRQASPSSTRKVMDAGTLPRFRWLILSALGISLASFMLNAAPLPLPGWATWASLLLLIAGLALRWAAVRQLGNAFTTKIAFLQGQLLHTNGVFAYIRHPSYAGLLLYDLGLGLAMSDLISILALTLLPALAVYQRIAVEERALSQHFGPSYARYKAATGALFPNLKRALNAQPDQQEGECNVQANPCDEHNGPLPKR